MIITMYGKLKKCSKPPARCSCVDSLSVATCGTGLSMCRRRSVSVGQMLAAGRPKFWLNWPHLSVGFKLITQQVLKFWWPSTRCFSTTCYLYLLVWWIPQIFKYEPKKKLIQKTVFIQAYIMFFQHWKAWKCWMILFPESVDSKFRNLQKKRGSDTGWMS